MSNRNQVLVGQVREVVDVSDDCCSADTLYQSLQSFLAPWYVVYDVQDYRPFTYWIVVAGVLLHSGLCKQFALSPRRQRP